MGSRALRRFPRSISWGSKEVKQDFNHLLLLDFEATCQAESKLEPQEIIEFPCLALSTKDWKVKNVFHKYVAPRIHPELTPFCTDLTGIFQDMVKGEPHFPEVFQQFCNWLNEHGYFKDDNKCAFVTCGDWDLRVMLPSQCALDGITVPECFKKWINLKQSFCDATSYYPRSLKNMLAQLNIELKGKLHSGIDDVENMAQIVCNLSSNYDINFKITSTPEIFKGTFRVLNENKKQIY